MRADNSRHLVSAARKRAERTRRRAVTTIRRLADNAGKVSFETVAEEAGVSRSWLYAQPDLRAQIEQLRASNPHKPAAAPPARQRATDNSLLRRLEAATDRIRHLEQQNRELQSALAQALGEHRQAAVTGRSAHNRDTPDKAVPGNLRPC
jgi:hypothetical protein